MAESIFSGVAASAGLVLGQLWKPELGGRSADGLSVENGKDALHDAIRTAVADLSRLETGLSGDEAEIVGMQLAFLSDEELARPAFEAIEAGETAISGWTTALQAEIAAYQESDDEYFRARAIDFQDIRDRVLDILSGKQGDALTIPDGAVLLARDLRPSQFLAASWGIDAGIALSHGSPTSHVAMLARGRGLPMVVALGDKALELDGQVILDGYAGSLTAAPDEASIAACRSRLEAEASTRGRFSILAAQPAVSRNGVRIMVHATIADPMELDALEPSHFDGIGLVRTELFLDRAERLMDEEAQLTAYRRILAWADGRPVTVRTLDAGGDKPIAGYTADHEANPFLGMRGIRLSLRHPEVFRVQLRALARAAADGPLKIMLPMVTLPSEIVQARAMLEAELADLAANTIPHGRPLLGIMVEVPTVAIAPERFDADFYSIGSNDLVQYTCAISRDEAEAAHFGSASDPSILALIARVVEHGRKSGREVSLCGDAGGDPHMVPELLATGLRSLSVQHGLAGAVKAAIAELDLNNGI